MDIEAAFEVTYGAAVEDPPDIAGYDDSAGWRISCRIDGVLHTAVRRPFASKRDAELALMSLQTAGIKTASDAMPLGQKRLDEIMYSALPW